jgi:CheY-like chemotaxis protein
LRWIQRLGSVGITGCFPSEHARVELESADFDVEDLVEGVLEILGPRAAEKGLEFGLRVDPGCPPRLRGDPARLRQVLLNLAGNAVKFTERGSVEVAVGPDPGPGPGPGPGPDPGPVRLRFSVSDTGIGIAPEARERIFEKFSQADPSTTRRFGGTGLGLAISRQLVGLMGGRIGAESEPGRGSTFWFTAELRPAAAAAAAAAALPPGAARAALQGRRALVVDDLEMNRRVLRARLERDGMVVAEAEDAFAGFAALERAWHRGEPFDVAVLDHAMPGMPGDALAERIRAHARLGGTRLVLLSSLGAPALRDKAARACFDAVLARPLRPKTVTETLTGLFGSTMQDGAATSEPP